MHRPQNCCGMRPSSCFRFDAHLVLKISWKCHYEKDHSSSKGFLLYAGNHILNLTSLRGYLRLLTCMRDKWGWGCILEWQRPRRRKRLRWRRRRFHDMWLALCHFYPDMPFICFRAPCSIPVHIRPLPSSCHGLQDPQSTPAQLILLVPVVLTPTFCISVTRTKYMCYDSK